MEEQETYYHKLQVHIQKIVPVCDIDFEFIWSFFTIKHLKKKEYLIRPSQVCKHESYILRGLFETAIVDDLGKTHCLYFPHEDWWVGDFKSFKTGKESCMEIQALEDSVLLQISKSSLEKLYETFPVFERFFRILNENTGIALQDRIVQNYSQNAEKKYDEFLSKYSSLCNRLSQKRIASFLGVSPEYFSQMLKKSINLKS